MGKIGNDGVDTPDYLSSVDQRLAEGNRGVFANGQNSNTSYENFDQNYEAINSFAQGSASGSYTVRGGETLQAIAAQTYGANARNRSCESIAVKREHR